MDKQGGNLDSGTIGINELSNFVKKINLVDMARDTPTRLHLHVA